MDLSVFIIGFAQQYPIIASILAIVATLRLVMKPVMTAIHEIVLVTNTKKDDEILGKVESNKIWKAFVFLVDWFASVKLPK